MEKDANKGRLIEELIEVQLKEFQRIEKKCMQIELKTTKIGTLALVLVTRGNEYIFEP